MVKNLKTAESAKLAWANWSPSCQMARYWQGLESPIIWNFTVNYPSIMFFCKQCYAVLPWLKFPPGHRRHIVAIISIHHNHTIHMDKSLVINLGFPWFSHGFPQGFPMVFPMVFPMFFPINISTFHQGKPWGIHWKPGLDAFAGYDPGGGWCLLRVDLDEWLVKVSKG